MTTWHKLTPALVEEIVAAYRSGKPISEIAGDYGVTKQAVLFHLKRRGVWQRQTPKLSGSEIADLVERWRVGERTDELAAAFGIRPRTVLGYISRHERPKSGHAVVDVDATVRERALIPIERMIALA